MGAAFRKSLLGGYPLPYFTIRYVLFTTNLVSISTWEYKYLTFRSSIKMIVWLCQIFIFSVS